MIFHSVMWAIAFTLFLGGLGIPVPENPVLIGGGYVIYQQYSPAAASLLLWFVAILIGDTILYALSFWVFTHPVVYRWVTRFVSAKNIQSYRGAFAARGGWTLFLARFTFGIRAAAYVAAGAAHYPWYRFLVVDGLSVAIQVLLFVGIGYFAGDRIGFAQATGNKVVLVMTLFGLTAIILIWLYFAFMRKRPVSVGKTED